LAALEVVFAAAGGLPKVLRMDNGPELVSQALQRFCEGTVGISYIPSSSKTTATCATFTSSLVPSRPVGRIRSR
jgi:hypothetical protein